MTHVIYGRCQSGRRWFWIAAAVSYGSGERHCGDPVCSYGGPHEHGWEDSEELALKAMDAAFARLGGQVAIVGARFRGRPPGNAGMAAHALKRINAAKRKARPPKPGANSTAVAEYLYEPWSSISDYDSSTQSGVKAVPILRKTPKRIYINLSDKWDQLDGIITQGYIDRAEFEADTRCSATCERDEPVLVCAEHATAEPHCVHAGGTFPQRRGQCYRRGGCGEDCPREDAGSRCGKHQYTWDHCPHGSRPGQCWRGYGPGEISAAAGHLFATEEAAWAYLRGRDSQEKEPDVRELRRAMAAAHPDRGGTAEDFIAARERYERALMRT